MRPALIGASSPREGAVRLFMAALVAVLLSLATSVAYACPSGQSAASASCACPCCELPASGSVQRAPCCVKRQPSAVRPAAFDVDPGARAWEVVAATVALPRAPLGPQIGFSPGSPIVRNTGPPVWLWCRALLL